MISGRETMTCTGDRASTRKSVMFSLVVLKCWAKFFLQMYNSSNGSLCHPLLLTIYTDYAIDIVFLKWFMLLPGKSESI